MPVYRHTCEDCNHTEDDFRPMARMGELISCPICGKPMPRDITGEARKGNPNFFAPIEMFSIAPETAEQRKALLAAGAEFTPDGVPMAHNRGEKMRLLQAAEYVEMS